MTEHGSPAAGAAAREEPRAEILEVMGPLRRYVAAHVRPQDVDDVVQEVLTRLIETRGRLEPDAVVAYGIVVARHLIADQAAAAVRARRHAPRVIDLREPRPPDEVLIQEQERAAVRAALAEIPADRRDALLTHVIEERPLAELAAGSGGSGTLGAQLARTRAQLRLEYVLALRRIELPTARCRPVLLALSAADGRRQRAVRAGEHLLNCRTCAEVSEPLLRRRSALAAVLPWFGIPPLLDRLREVLRTRPGQAGAALAATAVVASGAVVAGRALEPSPPAPPPAAASTPAPSTAAPAPAAGRIVRAADGTPLGAEPAALRAAVGEAVTGRAVPVTAVAADEGFWVTDTAGSRFWVQLTGVPGESVPTVRAGGTVDLIGTVTANPAGFTGRAGVGSGEDAARLTAQGAHLAVDVRRLAVHP